MGITKRRGGMNSPNMGVLQKYIVDMYQNPLSAYFKESTTTMDLSKLMSYLKNNVSESLLTQCQAIAGFTINDYNQLKKEGSGNPSKIYERLGKIASKNIVVLTEAGEVDGDYTDLNIMINGISNGMVDTPDVNNTIKGMVNYVGYYPGLKFDDNVFIYKEFKTKDYLLRFKPEESDIVTQDVPDLSIVKSKLKAKLGLKDNKDLPELPKYLIPTKNIFTLHKKVKMNDKLLQSLLNTQVKKSDDLLPSFSNFKYITSNGVQILNVHFPSDGPNQILIEDFLKEYLPTLTELRNALPDIIGGDTNITPKKCKSVFKDQTEKVTIANRKTIMEQMIVGIELKYPGSKWALLMSTTSVDKERDGGILINQQALKKKDGSKEPDGTAIFISMIYRKNDFKVNRDMFGTNWVLLWDNTFYSDQSSYDTELLNQANKVIDPLPDPVKFLHFDNEKINDCLDSSTDFLLDSLFIDHAPVQLSFDAFASMNTQIETTKSWSNLIVLNAGSITCSTKNWNLNIINYMNEIKNIDRQLFDEMNKVLNTEPLQNYESIGPEYGKWKITKNNYIKIAELLAKTHFDLSKLECFKKKANDGLPLAIRPAPHVKGYQTNKQKETSIRVKAANEIKKRVEERRRYEAIHGKGTAIGGKYTKKGKHKTRRK